MEKVKFTDFEVVDFLENEEDIQEYFKQILKDNNPGEIQRAIKHIAKARAVNNLAKDMCIDKEI